MSLLNGVASALLAFGAGTAPGDTTAFEFQAASAADWYIVNDGVMGGVSSSEFVDSGEGYAVFAGVLSLDNNGGFASVRGLVPDGAMADHTGIALRVRGDGRTYQVRFRTDRRFDGIAYMAKVQPRAGEWETIVIPFSEFEATWRGRTPRGAPPLDPGAIGQIGILIGDKVEAPFRLDVEWIRPAS